MGKKKRRRKKRKRLPQLKMGNKKLLLSQKKKKKVKRNPLRMVNPRRNETHSLSAYHSSLGFENCSLMDFLLLTPPTSFITTYDLYCSSSCSARTAAAAVRSSSSETKLK